MKLIFFLWRNYNHIFLIANPYRANCARSTKIQQELYVITPLWNIEIAV